MNKNSLYVKRYEDRHITRITLKFNRVRDAEILDRIRAAPSKIEYIRDLVKNDINKGVNNEKK